MADPRNANRGVSTEQPRKFLHPVLGYEMEDWEHEEWVREEEDAKITEKSAERDREARREELQYKTAFRTAFELGLKAGRMQRADPVPCLACEKRKERNRIAAQASRLEKRRLEQSHLAEIHQKQSSATAPQRLVRAPTGGALPPRPLVQSGPSVGVKRALSDSEGEDEDDEPPPF